MDDKNIMQNGRKILHISIGQVVPGLVTARDIYSSSDQLVLAKNVTLEANMIAKLMFYAIPSIYVYQAEEEQYANKSYYEKIQESEEFCDFHETYSEVLDEIKKSFNRAINGEQILNEDTLVQEINKILNKGRQRYHLFELLYCVNEYDNMTFAHSINVAIICNTFGQWLHMPEKDIDILTLCGLMHDVGKISMPKHILNKPGKLTNEEFTIIQKHTLKGYQLLLGKEIDPRIRLAALEHHERFDGTGYPLKKTGNQIHPFSMITAIADVFDAMTSNRIYRGAICPFSVLDMFEHEGKIQYDLSVSMPLMERIAEIYIHHTVRLTNKMQGEIIMLNQQYLSKPVVRIGEEFVDLSKHKEIQIEAVV